VKPLDVQLRASLKRAAKRAILEFGCAQDQYQWRPFEELGPGEKRFLTLCRQAYREAAREEAKK
jgi:hypothetical protein